VSPGERCRCGGIVSASGLCRCALPSLADRFRALPASARKAILAQLTPRELGKLLYEWRRLWARPNQLAPEGDWTFAAFIGGRGSGKTRCCAELVCERVRLGLSRRVHLIAATYDDARETMIEGESGIYACSRPEERPEFISSVAGGVLKWPNGARGRVFSAEEPKRLRGPQCDLMWCDDIAGWGVHAEHAWAMAMFGFRLGDPKCVISSSPLDMALLVSLIKRQRRGMVMIESSTDDNKGNLAASFFRNVMDEFAGTSLEQQERYGKLLVDDDGTMFKTGWIQRIRREDLPRMVRIVVAVDPAITEEKHSDDTGIVVLGLGVDDNLYILADLTGPHAVDKWPKLVVKAFTEYQADCVVAEVNRGGNLVSRNIRIESPNIPIREVTATRSKQTRAEPLALHYEKGRVFHVANGPGLQVKLYRAKKPLTFEDELTGWKPKHSRSPNGIDAAVWGAEELLPVNAGSPEEYTETADVYDQVDDLEGRERGFDRSGLRWDDRGWEE
jgi:phage terminase large subunit-like protein